MCPNPGFLPESDDLKLRGACREALQALGISVGEKEFEVVYKLAYSELKPTKNPEARLIFFTRAFIVILAKSRSDQMKQSFKEVSIEYKEILETTKRFATELEDVKAYDPRQWHFNLSDFGAMRQHAENVVLHSVAFVITIQNSINERFGSSFGSG